LILAVGFAYYFLGYVKVKEANLNERGFRILTLLGENIASKLEVEIKNAGNEIKSQDVSQTSDVDWRSLSRDCPQ